MQDICPVCKKDATVYNHGTKHRKIVDCIDCYNRYEQRDDGLHNVFPVSFEISTSFAEQLGNETLEQHAIDGLRQLMRQKECLTTEDL